MARSTHAPADGRRVVVVGAGLAGLFAALKLAPLPVTILAAKPLGQGASSEWAQAGIAAAVGEGDSVESHAADAIRASAGIANERIVRMMTAQAPDRIEDLLRYGVPFDHDLEGKLKLRREAAHSARRIVSVHGDMAGRQIMAALIAAARAARHIMTLEGYEAEEIVLSGGKAAGLVIRQVIGASNAREFLPAAAVVLATGGIGRLYAVTTNAADARGEGVAIAARAGAIVADVEFVQFHPTAIDVGGDPAPLATEALRGEGAILVNRDGDRFMQGEHQDLELAPRDVVARAVQQEINGGRGAFLDCRGSLGAQMAEMFPTVHGFCLRAGIDPASDLIPVAPAAHYHMGGVLTDADGRTSIDGLWACGEVASTGAHGANRLASNSLLEAVVFADRVARDINRVSPGQFALRASRLKRATSSTTGRLTDAETALMRRTMSAQVGVVRSRSGLESALSTFDAIGDRLARDGLTANSLLTARFVARAALAREESRGSHFRSDFPEADPSWQHRSYMRLSDLHPTDRPADRRGAA